MLSRATEAAKLWPFSVQNISLAAHRENAIYRVDASEGRFALRLHRRDYRSDVELHSELQYMAAIEAAGIAVPQPIASRNGAYLEHVDCTQVSVLSWLNGRPLGETGVPLDIPDRANTFRKFGTLIAQLHTASDNWKQPATFTRQAWDLEGLLGEGAQWGRFWDNPYLTSAQRTLLIATREKLRAQLQALDFDQGLIHADLVSENILLDDGQLRIIDFDDSGPGYRLQDLATALVKHEAEPDYETLKAELFAGYQQTRPLDEKGVELFLFVRRLSYLGWIVPRMTGADGLARCQRFIANVVPKAEAYMAQLKVRRHCPCFGLRHCGYRSLMQVALGFAMTAGSGRDSCKVC